MCNVFDGFGIIPLELEYTYSLRDPGHIPLFEEQTSLKKALVEYIFRRL